MVDIGAIFKDKLPDAEKLEKNGFVCGEKGYFKDFSIMQGQFGVKVAVAADGTADYRVYDAQTGDEYYLARVPDASGAFVGEINAACEEILLNIARECFYTERFQNGQTKRVLQYIRQKYGSEPEFLWQKFPGFAAIRNEKKVWFALLGKVEKRKFGIREEGAAEIINLKNTPETVTLRIEEHKAYPAYHMNKKCWFSVFLDDSLPDGEIFSLIDASFTLVNS